MDQRIDNAIDQTDDKQRQELENVEDRVHVVSPENDQSGNSSSCNGNLSHHHDTVTRSNGNTSEVSIHVKAASEFGNEEGIHVQEGACHRSIQREAALTKFRMKRKDRCFEKKVRYESRKKLAEQRPRVKGQFVRQVSNDPPQENSSAG